ncbi:TPA: type II secretion system F family protein [Staphylococcus aureus]|nr:type II secretion system F family protein [Staphylococcus aureus]HDC8535324.1 type II secretion system F family protein [Staphylococcus aureus]
MKLQCINTFKLHSKKRQLSKAQQIDLLSNLCNLLKYGFTLYQSFQFLNLQMTYKNKQLGTTILSEISNGAPCNQILSLIGYSDTIVMQVYLAERFGNIIDVLEEIVNYMKVNRKSEQRLLKTLQYPLILVSIFIAMIIILNLTVIPQFQQLYTSMNIQLSSFQKTLSFFITSLPTIIVVMLIIVSMLAIIMKLIYNNLNMLNKINFVMKLPLISGYFQLFKTYFVTNELVLFYKNGITLQSIVDVYINHSSDPFRQFLGKYLLTYSEMGYGLPQILEKLKCFKPQLIKFVLQGEKRGKLEVELKLYSQILVKQIEDKAIKQTQFLQPILFLILGLFIVAIYLVIMLPMFQMMQSIK